MKKKTEVVSIFGEIEEIVAKQMMAEGKGVGLLAPTLTVSLNDIPPSTRYNARGDRVRMVVVVPQGVMREFERRVEELRQ